MPQTAGKKGGLYSPALRECVGAFIYPVQFFVLKSDYEKSSD